jgi:deoxyribonuclease V
MVRHIWPGDIQTARRLQVELSAMVKICPLRKRPSLIAGVDAAFSGESVIAVASVFAYPSLLHRFDATSREEVRFPYIPGLLSFREGHAFLSAIRKLKRIPDVVIVDGQGIAHPKGIGIASHIGVLLGIPTIGCAKTRLVGEHAEPGPKRGQWTPLRYKREKIGAVLRTRDGVKPVFISSGHLIDLDSSIAIVLQSLTRYRLPEPIRRADRLSRELSKRDA